MSQRKMGGTTLLNASGHTLGDLLGTVRQHPCRECGKPTSLRSKRCHACAYALNMLRNREAMRVAVKSPRQPWWRVAKVWEEAMQVLEIERGWLPDDCLRTDAISLASAAPQDQGQGNRSSTRPAPGTPR